ncbi:CNPV059 putative serpin [Canarypox virus]|uniref:CNPV059 putative serpin n=1 Tax=Canarypox virus TaxID=44088 RepID=Q6VZT8_CNPV|nr:CNPV059 putative serpin [Canarypox virus]AAR83405.1 CNPV059 putative serpin [Canarypox virus]AWD84535.1 putative serpin [Canarypox virus]
MDLLKIQLDIAVKLSKYVRSMGTDSVIVAPCSIISSLCSLSKIINNDKAKEIYKLLSLDRCYNIDSYIRKIVFDMNNDIICYNNTLIVDKETSIDCQLQNALKKYYNLQVEHEDTSNINLCSELNFSASWNRPFTSAPEEQIRERKGSVDVVSVLKDSKRRLHLLRRLSCLKSSVVRTSLANNRYILTVITPDDDDEKIFESLENELSVNNLLGWIDSRNMKKTQHRFRFPEITMTSSYDFASLLKSVNVDLSPTIFSKLNPEICLNSDTINQVNTIEVTTKSINFNTKMKNEFSNNQSHSINCSSCSEIAVGKPFIFLIQCRTTENCLYFGILKDSF